MNKIKNKKALVAAILVAVLGIVGVTIAYFTSTNTFTNIFSTQPYTMEVTDTFQSPSNWTPGTTTDKTIAATNMGAVPAAVRISYTEAWEDSLGDPLPLVDGSNHRVAIINFPADVDDYWIESVESGTTYYYYHIGLKGGASTSSLMESVTFNPDVEISTNTECVEDPIMFTNTCTTTTSGYAGGTYTLTITIETVQYDQYQEAWGTSVTIAPPPQSEG